MGGYNSMMGGPGPKLGKVSRRSVADATCNGVRTFVQCRLSSPLRSRTCLGRMRPSQPRLTSRCVNRRRCSDPSAELTVAAASFCKALLEQAACCVAQVRQLFPSARGLQNTWHSIVKIQQSLYVEAPGELRHRLLLLCPHDYALVWCMKLDVAESLPLLRARPHQAWMSTGRTR